MPRTYEWGRVLISTGLAKRQLDIPAGNKGICLGQNGKSGLSIRVLRAGRKTSQGYHIDFWKPTDKVIVL